MIYPSVYLIAIDLLLWMLIFITFNRTLSNPYKVSIGNRRLGVFLIFLYILLSFWGDWFHYNKEIVLMHNGGGYGYEDVYNWIINNICFHYFIFRIIVWGLAYILFIKSVKRLGLNTDLALLFLGCGWISLFAYARVTLAMSIMFYGFTLIYTYKKYKILNHIFGLTLIFCAFFFHKTALFGMAMIIGGIILSRLNNKIVIAIFILAPLLVGLLRNYLVLFMLSGSGDFDSSLQTSVVSGQRYLQLDSEESGWGALIRSIFEYIAYYTMGFLCILYFFEKKSKLFNNKMRVLSMICLLTILCSSIFALDLGFNTKVLFVRFLRFSIIPILLLMSYFYQIGFHRRFVKVVFISVCCMTIYATLYTMYLCHLGIDLVNM